MEVKTKAKKKRRPPKLPTAQQLYQLEQLQPRPAQAQLEQLGAAGAHNLQYLEQWAASMPTVAGVPIVQALTYDLVQVLNRVGM
jgi:hypothetical protein